MEFNKMSVDAIRVELVKLGLTQEEADAIKGKSAVVDKYNELFGKSIDEHEMIKMESGISSNELTQEVQEPEISHLPEAEERVFNTDYKWHNYVMSLFGEDECVKDPKSDKKVPKVDGLRRVARELIGQIVESLPAIHNCPRSDEDRSATVSYTIKFENGYVFGGAADCSPANITGVYGNHPVAIAETRAEARALRKALGLRNVVAAEELDLSKKDEWLPECISDMQLIVLDKKCKEDNIDVLKFINQGTTKYENYRTISREIASQMVEQVNKYTRGEETIPEEIKGYKENWR